ncbi:hypothetical protein SPHINGO8AM_160030 [Sphingomonas sp. 8AM]|nr:hypothetical protein SPHINGO8AM_160030 [Sphingomonas sp. 8AM]
MQRLVARLDPILIRYRRRSYGHVVLLR